MRIRSEHTPSKCSGFSLIEALITIAIIGVLSGIVVTAVSNASQDTSRMIARQQQSAVQEAVNAWASSASMMRAGSTDAHPGQLLSVESTRAAYNAAATTSARFNLIKGFLDDNTADHFLTYTISTDRLKSEALTNAKQYLKLEDWAAGNAGGYPKVTLNND